MSIDFHAFNETRKVFTLMEYFTCENQHNLILSIKAELTARNNLRGCQTGKSQSDFSHQLWSSSERIFLRGLNESETMKGERQKFCGAAAASAADPSHLNILSLFQSIISIFIFSFWPVL